MDKDAQEEMRRGRDFCGLFDLGFAVEEALAGSLVKQQRSTDRSSSTSMISGFHPNI